MENLANNNRVNAHTADATALAILELIFAQRRLLPIEQDVAFDEQIAGHYEKVLDFVHRQQPINMVLPAFPANTQSQQNLGLPAR